MTLIIRHVSDKYLSRSISDLLISRKRQSEGLILLPFHEKRLNVSYEKGSLSGFAQKTVVFGGSRVSWAGSQVDAQIMIKAMYRLSEKGQKWVDPTEAANVFRDQGADTEEVSLIYDYINKEDMGGWAVHCETVAPNLTAAGSGVWDFFVNTEMEGRESPKTEAEVYETLIVNMFLKASRELFAPDYDWRYGGWFELTAVSGTEFVKIPIAIKVWPISDGVISPAGSLFFSHYTDHHLSICSVHESKGIAGQFDSRFLVMPDILSRNKAATTVLNIKFKPEIIAHIFVKEHKEAGFTEFVCELMNYDESDGFVVNIVEGTGVNARIVMDYTPEYYKMISKMSVSVGPKACFDVHARDYPA